MVPSPPEGSMLQGYHMPRTEGKYPVQAHKPLASQAGPWYPAGSPSGSVGWAPQAPRTMNLSGRTGPDLGSEQQPSWVQGQCAVWVLARPVSR